MALYMTIHDIYEDHVTCNSPHEFVSIQTGLYPVQWGKYTSHEIGYQIVIKVSYCTYLIADL